MAKGHTYDADTIMLWRFDDPDLDGGSTYSTIAYDLLGGHDFSFSNRVPIISGKVGLARGNSTFADQYPIGYAYGISSGEETLIKADFSFECWARLDANCTLHSGGDTWNKTQTLFSFGSLEPPSSGLPLVDNERTGLSQFSIEVAYIDVAHPRNIILRWNTAATAWNINTIDTGVVWPFLATWTHVAVTRKDNGANYTVKVYIDGALQATLPAVAKNPNSFFDTSFSGSRNHTNLGSSYATYNRDPWHGAIDDIRISKVERSGADILASYNNAASSEEDTEAMARLTGSGTVTATGQVLIGHWQEPDTLALWRLNEAAGANNAVDVTGAYTLTQQANPGSATGYILTSRTLNGTTQFFGTNAGDATAVTALLGEWTFEGWVNMTAIGADDTLLSYSIAHGGSSVTNTLISIRFQAGGLLKCVWENGNNVAVTSLQVAGSAVATGGWHHVAVRKKLVAGNYDVAFFYDGVLQDTITGKAAPTGGSSCKWVLGQDTNVGVGSRPAASVDDFRVSASARTDQQIAESATGAPPFPSLSVDGSMKISSVTVNSLTSLTVTIGSGPCLDADAMTVGNWTLSGDAVVTAVAQVTSGVTYTLTTTTLSAGTLYTLTGTNIRTLAGTAVMGSPRNFFDFVTTGEVSGLLDTVVNGDVKGGRLVRGLSIEPLSLSAAYLGGSTLRLYLNRAIRDLAITETPGRYTIGTGPTAATVTAVAYTPGDTFIELTLSVPLLSAGSYDVTVAADTLFTADGVTNPETAVPFSATFSEVSGSQFNTGWN